MRPPAPGLAVVRPGPFTTVQDQGRPGFRAWGVPVGGVFDAGSAALANALLGNPPGSAVVEMTLAGGDFEALAPLALAIAGASLAAKIVGRDGREAPLRPPLCFPLARGERLVLGGTRDGARAYLAALGGWQTRPVLGSRSSETPLRAGDLLPCAPGWTPVRHAGQCLVRSPNPETKPLRVIDGPDSARLGPCPIRPDRVYRVGRRSDRMGLRLEGPAWEVDAEPDRVSAPVAPGAVQIAGGRPLLLGVACGTMGGYPHVAHVISADLDRVGQARPGDQLRFEVVAPEEARRLDRLARSWRADLVSRVATAAMDRPTPPDPGSNAE